MDLPHTIANGEDPDGMEVQENFEYLAAGKGIKAGTVQELKDFAATAPTVPFIAIGTETNGTITFYGYCGNTTKGDDGFTVLGGLAGGTADDITSGDIG